MLFLNCFRGTSHFGEANPSWHCRRSSYWYQHFQRYSTVANACCSIDFELLQEHSTQPAIEIGRLRKEAAETGVAFRPPIDSQCLALQNSGELTQLLLNLNSLSPRFGCCTVEACFSCSCSAENLSLSFGSGLSNSHFDSAKWLGPVNSSFHLVRAF